MKKLFSVLCAMVVVALFSSSAQAALQIQSWNLANGARVLFVENHTIPILDLDLGFDAGARRDPAEKAGLAELTNAMLARGIRAADLQGSSGETKEPALSEAQLSNAFADLAAERGGGAGADRASVSLRSLSSEHERSSAVKLLARMVAQPSFPNDFLQRDKARTIAALNEAMTQPGAIANKVFWSLLYGQHPYGREATAQTVAAIARDDLIHFHQQHYVANRAIVTIIGDVSRVEADAIAQQLTQRLPQGTALLALPDVPVLPAQERRIPHPASQAHILLGVPTEARGDADYFSLMVGNYVLGGGGFVSRLTQEVREKRGLTYGVYSGFVPMAQKGPFQIGLQTKKENAKQALQLVRATLATFLRDGPTDAELQAAKDNLIGGFPLRIDNNRKILANVAMIGFYQLPLDYLDTWTAHVAAVNLADIRAAFQRKLVPDRLSTVIVGGL